MVDSPDHPWFKPKEYGYGAYPISWEGWASILALVIVVGLVAWWLMVRPAMAGAPLSVTNIILFLVIDAALVVGFIFFAKSKTSADWGWRSGSANR